MIKKSAQIIVLFILLGLNFPGFSQSPYKTDFTRESVIFGTGLGFGLLALPLNDDILPLTIDEINNLDRNNINSFDRSATFNYSITEGKYSDILQVSLILSPALLAFSKEIRSDFSPVLTMYFETLLLATSVPFVTKGITKRVRPFAYNESVPLSERQSKNAKRSFFSGHVTTSFAIAVFISSVYSDYFPDSDWRPVVWAGSLALATTVGILRYSSGSHFPTDIITGAVVGSAIGYFIPFLHRIQSDKFNVSLGSNLNREMVFIKINF